MTRPGDTTRFRVAVAAVTLLVAAIGALWATITPGFRAPDEPHHVNSILTLADGGGWPPPGENTFLQGTFQAAHEAGWVSRGNELVRQNSHEHPGGVSTWATPFVLLVPDPVDAADRTSILDLPWRVNLFEQVDQMTQHPPGYYALAAGYLKVLGADHWAWDRQLLALRLLDVALISGLAPLTVLTVRRLGGSRSASLVGAVALTAPSQLLFINGAVTNDAALNLAGAGVVALSTVVLTSPWHGRHVVGLGLVLGAGLMVKGFMLALIPLVALAFLMSTGTSRPLARRALAAVASLAVAFAVGGWWWLKNLVVHGTFQRSGYPARAAVEDPSALSVPDFLIGAVRSLVRSTWGNYGWLESPWPLWWQAVLTAAVLATMVVVMMRTWRGLPDAGTGTDTGTRTGADTGTDAGANTGTDTGTDTGASTGARTHPGARHGAEPGPGPVGRHLLVLSVGLVGVLGIVLYGAWQEYLRSGVHAGLQGRYLFVVILVPAAAVALAVDRATARISRRRGTLARTGAALACLGLAAYGLWFGFTSFYVEFYESFGRGVARWNDWSHVGIPKMLVLVLGTCALGAVSLTAVWRQAWRDLAPAGKRAEHPAAADTDTDTDTDQASAAGPRVPALARPGAPEGGPAAVPAATSPTTGPSPASPGD